MQVAELCILSHLCCNGSADGATPSLAALVQTSGAGSSAFWRTLLMFLLEEPPVPAIKAARVVFIHRHVADSTPPYLLQGI